MVYSSEIVTLNVGGVVYTTSRSTLTTDPDSMLGVMFGESFSAHRDEKGHYFIDADGELFKCILSFLRRNRLILPNNFDKYDALLAEAEFFQIQPLIKALRRVVDSRVLALNVGGMTYNVSMKLLEKYPTSALTRFVRTAEEFDINGTCFIDGNGPVFQHVLDFLRRDELILPEDFKQFDLLLMEAQFYGIEPLTQSIRNARHQFDVISLDVGGDIYHTTLKTLRKYPNSSLCRMLRTVDDKGRYVINGNGEMFRYVLDFLRTGELNLPSDFKSHDKLLEYAILYDIPPLVHAVKDKKGQHEKLNNSI